MNTTGSMWRNFITNSKASVGKLWIAAVLYMPILIQRTCCCSFFTSYLCSVPPPTLLPWGALRSSKHTTDTVLFVYNSTVVLWIIVELLSCQAGSNWWVLQSQVEWIAPIPYVPHGSVLPWLRLWRPRPRKVEFPIRILLTHPLHIHEDRLSKVPLQCSITHAVRILWVCCSWI